MNIDEALVGLAEIAIALAGFTGVVVAFGSRSEGAWHPGDRLRLGFLLEASLTAVGFALLGLLLISINISQSMSWIIGSAIWALYMTLSLTRSHLALKKDQDTHGDVDRFANWITTGLFVALIAVQVANIFVWQAFWPFLAGILLNLAGAAMQFARLIRSAFHA